MGVRIHQLSALIANQIAAGEVIERPASVVKELLENSLDAGALKICIEIHYGGLNQIKVSDNGQGIVAEDLPLAVAAHATSKISCLDDLNAIDSMGFRGEALASIASVAKLSISSKPDFQGTAMMLEIVNEQFKIVPCARNNGTTIIVDDLFFNAPVRKRFLKSEKLEFQAIENIVKQFALSASYIHIVLKHNNKLILDLPAAIDNKMCLKRLRRLFGSAFVNDANRIDAQSGAMSISGWCSGMQYQRSQNDRQWVYINQRMVKDKLINHALRQVYSEQLHPGRFPACVIYLEIPFQELDVNVHPTKYEVRFQQPRLVHDFVISNIKKVIQSRESNKNYVFHTNTKPLKSPLLEQDDPSLALESLSVYENTVDKYSWVILSDNYVLMTVKKLKYIIDIKSLYTLFYKKQMELMQLPLLSRPLLIPFTYKIENTPIDSLEYLINMLSSIGICATLIHENILHVTSIPILTPYLDLFMFLNSIFKQRDPKLINPLDLLTQNHVFNVEQVHADEQRELGHFFVTLLNATIKYDGVFTLLTDETCRNLINA